MLRICLQKITKVKFLLSGAGLDKLSPEAAHSVLQSFVLSFHDMFLLAVPIALLAFVVALFLRETPLRSHGEPAIPE